MDMDLEDIINMANKQYEDVDSKEEKTEEKIDVEKILEVNKISEKWMDELREEAANSKDGNFSKNAFTRRSENYKTKDEKDKEKEKEKERSSSGYYGKYYGEDRGYGYNRYESSSKKSEKSFYEKVEDEFNKKVDKMTQAVLNEVLNRVEEDYEWDILDIQYELNNKRILDRDFVNEPIAVEFTKRMKKLNSSCSRKIEFAELLTLLKINPYGETK